MRMRARFGGHQLGSRAIAETPDEGHKAIHVGEIRRHAQRHAHGAGGLAGGIVQQLVQLLVGDRSLPDEALRHLLPLEVMGDLPGAGIAEAARAQGNVAFGGQGLELPEVVRFARQGPRA